MADALLACKESSAGEAGSLLTASTVASESRETHLSNAAGDPETGKSGAFDLPSRPTNDDYFTSTATNSSFGTIDDQNVLSDISWTDLFTDYFPAQSGFESAFLIEDLFV